MKNRIAALALGIALIGAASLTYAKLSAQPQRLGLVVAVSGREDWPVHLKVMLGEQILQFGPDAGGIIAGKVMSGSPKIGDVTAPKEGPLQLEMVWSEYQTGHSYQHSAAIEAGDVLRTGRFETLDLHFAIGPQGRVSIWTTHPVLRALDQLAPEYTSAVRADPSLVEPHLVYAACGTRFEQEEPLFAKNKFTGLGATIRGRVSEQTAKAVLAQTTPCAAGSELEF